MKSDSIQSTGSLSERDKPSPFQFGTWYPIETCRLFSGQRVLLSWKCCQEPFRGYWDIDEEFEGRPIKWRSPECGWRNDADQCIPRNQEDCTHWMPLPKKAVSNGDGTPASASRDSD